MMAAPDAPRTIGDTDMRTLGFLATAGFTALAGMAQAETFTLRFQHHMAPSAPAHDLFMQPWIEHIAAESGGRLKIELYPFQQLGGTSADQLSMIRSGEIDGGFILPAALGGAMPEAEALELPQFGGYSAEAASAGAWAFAQAHLLDDLDGLRLIAAQVSGPVPLHLNDSAPVRLSDLENLRVAAESRPAEMLLTLLGAEPVHMTGEAMMAALTDGAVDGATMSWDQAPHLDFAALTQSHTAMPEGMSLGASFGLWAMNEQAYAALPDDLRAILDAHMGVDASRQAGRALDMGAVSGEQFLDASGNWIATLSGDEAGYFGEAVRLVTEEWMQDMDAAGHDGAALVASARNALLEAASEVGAHF